MNKTLQHKILAAVIAASNIGLYTANPVSAENYYTVEKGGEIITGNYDIILGNGHNFTFDNGSVSIVLGAGNLDGTASSNGSTIYIGQNAEIGSIRGGFSQNAVSGNTIYFNGTVHQDIYGGYSIAGPASENTVILNGTLGETSQIYGGFSIAGDAVKITLLAITQLYTTKFTAAFPIPAIPLATLLLLTKEVPVLFTVVFQYRQCCW